MEDFQIQNQNHQPLVESNRKFDEISDNFHKTLTLQSSSSTSREIKDEEQRNAEIDDETVTLQHSSTSKTQKSNEEDEDEEMEEESGEFEFCFFGEEIKSPVSAEEVFEDGQIRIISPFSGEPLNSGDVDGDSPFKPPVKKMYVVSTSPENDDVAGQYCVWESPSPTPEMSKKSNSTGFSKLWKVRELLSRSNSDGKDAYVFLKNDDNNNVSSSNTTSFFRKKNKVKLEKLDVRKRGGETEKKESCSSSSSSTTTSFERKENISSSTTTSLKKKKSAYEVLYGENKKKGSGGGKSYLPYKVGFFTNGSGLSRNVHPY